MGHLGCTEDERLPKKMLFGELEKKRPQHGTRKRWRHLMSGAASLRNERELVSVVSGQKAVVGKMS